MSRRETTSSVGTPRPQEAGNSSASAPSIGGNPVPIVREMLENTWGGNTELDLERDYGKWNTLCYLEMPEQHLDKWAEALRAMAARAEAQAALQAISDAKIATSIAALQDHLDNLGERMREMQVTKSKYYYEIADLQREQKRRKEMNAK